MTTVYEIVEKVKLIDEVIDALEKSMGFNFKDEAIELLDDYKTMLYRLKVNGT